MGGQKRFNTTGVCVPELHYMVDINEAVDEIIEKYIEKEAYFTMDRAGKFGKTTTLKQLCGRLRQEYVVIYISFASADDCFTSLHTFAQGFVNKVAKALETNDISGEPAAVWGEELAEDLPMDSLNRKITKFCRACGRGVILVIDEVDKSADNQIFLYFLGMLREKYLACAAGRDQTFRSVILAGVYDGKNLKLKLRPGEEAKYNSPWDIAADFSVDMSFSQDHIAGMLMDYEMDYHTGMDIWEMAELIFSYTKGYPYLVSCICKTVDEVIAGDNDFFDRNAAWTREGILEAVKLLVKGPGPLHDDVIRHAREYPKLRETLCDML